jgi:hypothetical protein
MDLGDPSTPEAWLMHNGFQLLKAKQDLLAWMSLPKRRVVLLTHRRQDVVVVGNRKSSLFEVLFVL